MPDRRSGHQMLMDWLELREGERPQAVQSPAIRTALQLDEPEALRNILTQTLQAARPPSLNLPGALGLDLAIPLAESRVRPGSLLGHLLSPSAEAMAPASYSGVSEDIAQLQNMRQPGTTAGATGSWAPPAGAVEALTREKAAAPETPKEVKALEALKLERPAPGTAGPAIEDWQKRWGEAIQAAKELNVAPEITGSERFLRILTGLAAGASRRGRPRGVFGEVEPAVGPILAAAGAGGAGAAAGISKEVRDNEELVKQRAQQLALTELEGEQNLLALRQANDRLAEAQAHNRNMERINMLEAGMKGAALTIQQEKLQMDREYHGLRMAEGIMKRNRLLNPHMYRVDKIAGDEEALEVVGEKVKPYELYARDVWLDGADPQMKEQIIFAINQGWWKDAEGKKVEILDPETGLPVIDLLKQQPDLPGQMEAREIIIERTAMDLLRQIAMTMGPPKLRHEMERFHGQRVYSIMGTTGSIGASGSY